MHYIVEVEYGYYEPDDVYHGPIAQTLCVEADSETAAQTRVWEQIKGECGLDQLTGEKVVSIRKQVTRCDACQHWEWENTGVTGIPNGKCKLHNSYPDGSDAACADAQPM